VAPGAVPNLAPSGGARVDFIMQFVHFCLVLARKSVSF